MFSSWHRVYWLGGAALAILLIVAIAMNPWLGAEKRVKPQNMGLDFVAFYTAGTFVREGRGAELYSLPAVSQFQQKLAQDNDLALQNTAAWWNPPVFAWIFAPLSELDLRSACRLWLIFNACCLVCAMALLLKLFPREVGWQNRGLTCLLIGVSMPTIEALGHAQNSCISLLIVVAAFVLAKNNRALMAGIVLGILLYKPQIAVAVAIIYALAFGWRVSMGLGAAGALLMLVNALTLPGTLQHYATDIGSNLHIVQFTHAYIWERQVTLGGFWRLLLQGRLPAQRSPSVIGLTLFSQAALAISLFVLWRQTRDDVEKSEGFVITALTGMPLLLPYFLDYDLLLLALPAVLYAARSMRQPRWAGTLLWTALYICLLVNPGVGRITHVNIAVLLLLATVAGMIRQFAGAEGAVILPPVEMDSFRRRAA